MRPSRRYARRITEGPTPADQRPPELPYPDGWFAVAFAAELTAGTVLTRPLQGEDVVLYRLRDGGVRAVRPYCPHLGAHLGLAGLEGDDLVCAFHRFAFGPDGSCVRTAYGTPPRSAALTRVHVREANDMVLVWRHQGGRPPLWEPPAWHALGDTPPRTVTWEMSGHSQDVIENVVDLGHFSELHGWGAFEVSTPLVFRERTFQVSMRHAERFPLLGETTLEVEVEACGLSRLHICTAIPRLGLRTCTLLCPTMITPNRLQLRHVSRIALSEPGWLPGPSARWLSRIAARLLSGPTLHAGHAFLAADFPIWDTKRYQSPPRLVQGDGPIGPYRHWARRFYSSPQAGPAAPRIGPARTGDADVEAKEEGDRAETPLR
ncbi:Rieske 2Fe-2S domain-containing protein [Streptantibioticus silvisoli]|uniref:Rieske-type oxygenase n=1 Tax=Streptantibioticus silvisoli TaxID=2705255 RepID=A0ABT6W7K7_9ACTN|nr:Rieske 2Fe-2S domain-containing protein [Streptantibioticus silvisoli]MDI5965466.1 Rieske 2Fe-2S domain-containing protein [Streptantibioticus silvisoli]